MTDYTARNVLLKDSSGNYLIPYTEKADLSLGNLNSAGKAYVAIKGYDSTATYSLNEVVMTVVSGSVLFYRSLVDNNTASLSDTTKWSEVSFGSGANVDLSNLSSTGLYNTIKWTFENIQDTDSSKVGYVYQTSTAPGVSISTPNVANSKWLVLQAILTNSSGVAYYIEGTGGIRNRAGTIVDGNTICVSSASYYNVFAAIRVQ